MSMVSSLISEMIRLKLMSLLTTQLNIVCVGVKASTISSVTESALSLNIVTVTLNLGEWTCFAVWLMSSNYIQIVMSVICVICMRRYGKLSRHQYSGSDQQGRRRWWHLRWLHYEGVRRKVKLSTYTVLGMV